MYPRVHECTLASKVPLLYVGFVHCGGAFHTPTHYGTNTVKNMGLTCLLTSTGFCFALAEVMAARGFNGDGCMWL